MRSLIATVRFRQDWEWESALQAIGGRAWTNRTVSLRVRLASSRVRVANSPRARGQLPSARVSSLEDAAAYVAFTVGVAW